MPRVMMSLTKSSPSDTPLHSAGSPLASILNSSTTNTVDVKDQRRDSICGAAQPAARVPIPALSISRCPTTQPPRNMGPLSAEVKIPPRPKPGRKPMVTDGEGGEKRKAQNRNAQRRFRDKRQQKLEDQVIVNEDLQRELQEITIKHEQSLNAIRLQNQAEVQALQQQIQRQQDEIAELRAALAKAETEKAPVPVLPNGILSIRSSHDNTANIHTHPAAHAQAIDLASTPPNDNEIDFTNYGRNMGTDDKCGFCGTGDTCPCSQSAAALSAPPVVLIAPAPPPPSTVATSGPGTCEQCRSDPTGERARQCREMAMSSTSTSNTSSTGSVAIKLPQNRFGRKTTPCSIVVDAFQHAHAEPSSISTLFGGKKMRAYAAANSAAGGFDFEHAEAAKVLVQLNERAVRNDSPLDGRY